MSMQKALLLQTKQGSFAVATIPKPTPGPGEILVKNISVALNPVDWKIQDFGWLMPEYPAVLGTDAAGVVEELGEGATGFKKGDEVFFQGWFDNPHGNFQQYCVVPAEIVAKIPKNLTADQAAGIPLGLATAVVALYNRDVEKKDSVGLIAPWEEGGMGKYSGPFVIFGGATTVGQYVIQVAKLSGFLPIIATASPHSTDLVKSLGATHVVDRNLAPDALRAAILEITGEPPKFVYDAISLENTQSFAAELVAPGGNLIIVLSSLIPEELASGRQVTYVFGNVHTPANRKTGVIMYSKVTELFENGTLKPNRVEVLPGGLAGIPAGLQRMRNNEVSGCKLIARPQETE